MAWNELRDAVREHLCLEDALHVVVLSLPQELWRSPLPSWPMGAGTPAWPGTLRALPIGTSLCTCRVSWGLTSDAVLAASIATSACSGCTILVLFCILLALNVMLFPFSFIPQSHLLSRHSPGRWMSLWTIPLCCRVRPRALLSPWSPGRRRASTSSPQVSSQRDPACSCDTDTHFLFWNLGFSLPFT